MFPKEICLSHWLLKILMFWPKLSTYRSLLPCPSAVHLQCLGWRIWNGKVCCWQQWRDGISSSFRRWLGTHHSRFFTGVIQMIIWCWLYCSCQVRYANFFFLLWRINNSWIGKLFPRRWLFIYTRTYRRLWVIGGCNFQKWTYFSRKYQLQWLLIYFIVPRLVSLDVLKKIIL